MIQNFEAIAKHNDFSLLGLTHALLCGAKATCTYYVSNCAEQCRLSCGGHGFAHYSGLPIICFELAPNVMIFLRVDHIRGGKHNFELAAGQILAENAKLLPVEA